MPRLKEGASVPRGASLEDLERHKASIMREMEKNRGADKKEVDGLKSDLAEANEWIKARKKADEAREEGSETTIVVPPNTMAPEARNENKVTDEHNAPKSDEAKKRTWKSLW